MAFLIHSVDGGFVPPWEAHPAAAATYKVGQAMVYSGGRLVSVSSGVGEDTDEGPHYVCMQNITIATNDDPIVVVAAKEAINWEVPIQADDADLAAGNSYTIHTDGLQMTGTTTKGCCLVKQVDGKSAGDTVVVQLT